MTIIKLKFIERIFVILGLFISTGALIHLFSDVNYGVNLSSGNILMGILLGAIYGISLLLVLVRANSFIQKGIIESIKKNSFLFVFLFFAFFSILWSSAQQVAMVRILGVFGSTIFAIYFSLRFNCEEKIDILSIVLKIIILLCAIFIYFAPNYGTLGVGVDTWRGIFLFKNELGRIALLAFGIFFLQSFVYYRGLPRLILNILFMVTSIFFVVMSNTSTALAVLPAVLLVLFFFYLVRVKDKYLRRLLLFAFFVIGILFAIIVLTNLPLVLEFMGRDETLTGRTDLWAQVFLSILHRPFVGYGFYGFWTGFDGASATIYPYLLGNQVIVHAHNGFLEMALDLGIIGTLLIIIHFLSVFIRSFNLAFIKKRKEGIFYFLYLLIFLTFNLTTVLILKEAALYWIIYTAISLSIYLEDDKKA